MMSPAIPKMKSNRKTPPMCQQMSGLSPMKYDVVVCVLGLPHMGSLDHHSPVSVALQTKVGLVQCAQNRWSPMVDADSQQGCVPCHQIADLI
jgi:hypothetical protein